MEFDLQKNTVLLTVAGSRAYGLHTDSSDVDVKGVAIPPKEYVLGFSKTFEQADSPSHLISFVPLMTEEEQRAIKKEKLEGSVYSLQKFMHLASNANPNILDVLYCRDSEVRLSTDIGETLRENRDLFLSKKAKFTFAGYAFAQLKRIKGRREWLLAPPSHKPTREEFELPEFTLIPKDQMAIIESFVQQKLDEWSFDFAGLDSATIIAIEEQLEKYMTELAIGSDEERWVAAARNQGIPEYTIEVLKNERRYKAAAQNWKQYQNWKETRNPERAELEKKYGYDTKHGAHLVRLLRMGHEILATGTVNVWRKDDADELLAIRKHGLWTYEQLIDWAERSEEYLNDLYKTSKLQRVPRLNELNDLSVKLMLKGMK